MTLARSCCCGPCWYGFDVTTGGYCSHNTDERLEFRCPRPAYTYAETILTYTQNPAPKQPTCGCLADTYKRETSCPASSDIVVRYEHFHQHDPTKLYSWRYEKDFSFGALFPLCENACCGYTSDSVCCSSFGTSPSCDPNFRSTTGARLSPFQVQAITNGSVPANVFPAPSQNTSAAGCEFGNIYRWLDGLADAPTIRGSTYNHYTVASGVVFQSTVTHLVEALLCVIGPTKWWQRSYNSMARLDGDGGTATDRAAAALRTPEWFVYACAQQPIFTFEIKDMSSLTTVQADDFIIRVHNGDPIPEAYIDILISDGIIQKPQDWGTAGGDAPLKKTVQTTQGASQTFYWYMREAGWSYACSDFSSTPAADLAALWPQIPFRTSTAASGFQWGDSCLSATAGPGNGCTCTSSGGPCNACGSSPPAGCLENPSPACDQGSGPYQSCGPIEIGIGNCSGLRAYAATYQRDIPTAGASDPFSCQSNQATLGRYPSADEPADPYLPAPIDYTKLPPPVDLSHFVPWQISRASNQGNNPNSVCCGGAGVFRSGSATICPATSPTGASCT